MDATESAGGPLRKAFAVLEALAAASRPLTLSELSRLVGQPKSTLHRTMRVLTDLRLAVRRESKYYEVGDYLFQMAATSGAARAQDLSYPITPFLIELFQLTRKIVSVGMLSGTNVHHVGTLYRQEHARLAMALRNPFPAHRSAAGRLLIAKSMRNPADFGATTPVADTRRTVTGADPLRRELDQIRRTGLSYARSEYIPGLIEVAAPVHLGKANPVAAIVVGDTVNNMDLRRVGRVLLQTVGAIEQNLAGAC
jgi:IclR family KDG regulon transcriptional repressor